MNNSDKDISWAIDLRTNNPAIEQGVLKFIHPSGVPFTNPTGEETKGIEGELKPGETQQVAVGFCPSKFIGSLFAYQGPINWNRVPGGFRTVE